MAKKVQLTATLRQQILGAIRAGGYPHVAAEAYGVARDVFDDWLERGSHRRAGGHFRTFAREVRAAQAQARLRAETSAFEKTPKVWLEHGPGRERQDNPGWSSAVAAADGTPAAFDPWRQPELLRIFRAVLTALVPFPEARAAVADTLANLGGRLEEKETRDDRTTTTEPVSDAAPGTPAETEDARGAGGSALSLVPTAAGGTDGAVRADLPVPVP